MTDNTEKKLIAILPSVISVVLGLLIGWILLLIADPKDSLGGMGTILSGGFIRGAYNAGIIMHMAAPIILTGLSVGFSAKSGLFNMGASGQFSVGAFCAILIGIYFPDLPPFIHITFAILGACAAGALWGALSGALKTYCGVSEVISGIMLNYTAMLSVNLFIKKYIYNSSANRTLNIADSSIIGSGLEIDPGFFIAIACAVLIKILLDRTAFGFELVTTGKNRNAARYAGINSDRCVLMSMIIAGALAGLGGAVMYLSDYGEHLYVIEKIAPQGFTGISVALLGMSSPWGILAAGIFIAYITSGGGMLQLYGYTSDIIAMIIAIMVYCGALTVPIKKAVADVIAKIRIKQEKSSGEEGAR